MKFLGKMCFKIILKFTKKQIFILSLEDAIFEKPRGWGGVGGSNCRPAVLVLKSLNRMNLKFSKISSEIFNLMTMCLHMNNC